MLIILYGEFTSLNKYIAADRRNRFVGGRVKKDNGDMAMKQLTLKEIVAEYPVEIKFTWITKNERVDPDNTSFAKKYILDALVSKGILRNDTRKDICGFSDRYGVDKDFPRVEIEITNG